MQVHLFGGVTVTTDDGEPLDLGPPKCQAVLAALALSPGVAVTVSRIVELVWGEVPPRTAEKTLQSYVTRLRKGLGPASIARTGAAYRLDLDPASVDISRFRRRLERGDVQAALAEWSGPPLAGLDAEGFGPAVDGLREQWLHATEADLGARLEADPAAVVAPLTELTATHPYREGLWALLMTALYRVGRQADALAAYRNARRHLVEELGVEPGPRLRQLEAQILGHDPTLAGNATTEDASRDTGNGRGNLPRRAVRLLGRAEELDAVAAALAGSLVVTLVGPGGIGKTTLALAAARQAESDCRDGAWLVELAEISSAHDVARALADVMGVKEGAGRTLGESVVGAFRSRDALLVLDNCEHVVDGAAELVDAIAEVSPGTRILATSREGLGLADEQIIAVGPLAPTGAAAELFNERALAADRSFDPSAHRADVEEICLRLDGVPLAIELAAARTRSLSPSDLVERLDDRLRLLTGGRRTGLERHRTLRATIQWSHDLLSDDERGLFERLSVFAGPFDLGAAETVGAGHDLDRIEVADLLGSLVERSMVLAEPGQFGRQFRLLETMRQFGAERLADAGAADLIAQRHAEWCRTLVAEIGVLKAGQGELEAVARLSELWPNLRAAVDWACSRGDYVLADHLVRPIASEVQFRFKLEIGDWAERILEITPPADHDRIAVLLLIAAYRNVYAQDAPAYERLVERYGEQDRPLLRYARAFLYDDNAGRVEWGPRAVAELHAHGEHHIAESAELGARGHGLMGLGRFEESEAVVTGLAERYRVAGPPTLHHWALTMLGVGASLQSRQTDADRFYDAAARVAVPDRTFGLMASIEARTALRRGEPARAFRILGSHFEELLEDDNMYVAGVVSVEFVNMMVAIDYLEPAARVVAYLETTAIFGEGKGYRRLVAAAIERIAEAKIDSTEPAGRDDREALEYMRGVLAELEREARKGGRPQPRVVAVHQPEAGSSGARRSTMTGET